ncbi:hypothetical protein KQ51_01359 [Candidatus Izimaplasma bacterium HR1]|jgi:hypothetical protein|uniref:hypothetical protein n=1 Tax=Candidatus Izimoplasma sp. HR1 TaxID=1541959 RepID=UPI0004F68E52|nr:hypothetical protein KQ51_01359 [Candidatus Izimaplasma bacterium HR1]
MDLTILNIIGLSIFIGLPLFFSRLRILKNERETKLIYIQSFILLIYVVLITLGQYINIRNTDIYMTEYIVYFWIGYYFVIDPLIVYVFVFLQNREMDTTFLLYFIKSTLWTFIWTTIAVILFVTYVFSSGALLV